MWSMTIRQFVFHASRLCLNLADRIGKTLTGSFYQVSEQLLDLRGLYTCNQQCKCLRQITRQQQCYSEGWKCTQKGKQAKHYNSHLMANTFINIKCNVCRFSLPQPAADASYLKRWNSAVNKKEDFFPRSTICLHSCQWKKAPSSAFEGTKAMLAHSEQLDFTRPPGKNVQEHGSVSGSHILE